MNITCPHCGNEAPGGRVLCPQCGGKLHTAPAQKTGARRVASGVGKGIRKLVAALIKLCVYAVIFGLIGLMVWPVAPSGTVGPSEEAARVHTALTFVKEAKKASRPAHAPFSESQLNAYFKQQVSETSSTGGGVQLVDVNVDIHPQDLLLNAGTMIGPVKLTWEITLEPRNDAGAFPFEVVKARVGHLPMLGGLKQFAADKAAGLFANFDEEKELLESVQQVKLSEGGIILSVSK